jgi:ectoine hydroxylase-related dioxygenase (phytanoyl-CoA dioxygenase family)
VLTLGSVQDEVTNSLGGLSKVSSLWRHPKLNWVREYTRFLVKMGERDPATLVKDLPAWTMYSLLPGLTRRSFTPPILSSGDVAEAVKVFYRDGFVVIADGLTQEEASQLKAVVKHKADEILKLEAQGLVRPELRHGDKRYSYGEYGANPEWEHLAQNPRVLGIVKAIWKGRAFRALSAQGDFVLPGGTWQPLHNDMIWRGAGEKVPRVVITNYYVSDVLPSSGPIRQIAGTARFPVPNRVVNKYEPSWMRESIITGKPGYAVIRDPRVWHGGTPNTSTEPRYMPNVEYVLRDVDAEEIGGTLNLNQLNQQRWIAEFENA